ncbi:T9SS type A sorting domain-containing protein [uncultured Marixanthomonas sp.]|uniref:T9SS type A sorting domain-containing protein n=1 Tax=uncultured Marixanthomonas sp. TaxID=757245 RepID=UPI0030DC8F06|tara:strand:+ start:37355 stop:38614 length:1260 start_codon:yes stop_codon:yes gene_type:complete
MKTTTILKQVILLWALCFGIGINAQDVYIAGYDNAGSSEDVAQIWDGDGAEHQLTDGNYRAGALDIFVYEGDEYVAGYEENGSRYVAKLWKNGNEQILTDGSDFAGASSVFVSDGDVYVAGHEFIGEYYVAIVWKNGIAQNLTDGSTEGIAYSVFVSGSDVYVAGHEGYETNVAMLWKNGTPQALSDGSTDAVARSVFVSGSDVYVAGYEDNGTHDIAKLWKNGNAQNLTDGSSTAKANSVFVNNGDVYVAGYDGDDPKLWKNGVPEPLSINSAFDGAEAKSVYVTGNDVYVAGTSTATNGNDECTFATLWKNGTIVVTSFACPENNAMNSVFVDDGQLGTENLENPKNLFSLYPNPVEDVLHIQMQEPTKLQLYSLQGRLLKEIEGGGQDIQLDMSGLASGVYFLNNKNGDSRKVVKE